MKLSMTRDRVKHRVAFLKKLKRAASPLISPAVSPVFKVRKHSDRI